MKVISLFATSGPMALWNFMTLVLNNLLSLSLNLLMGSLHFIPTLLVVLIWIIPFPSHHLLTSLYLDVAHRTLVSVSQGKIIHLTCNKLTTPHHPCSLLLLLFQLASIFLNPGWEKPYTISTLGHYSTFHVALTYPIPEITSSWYFLGFCIIIF